MNTHDDSFFAEPVNPKQEARFLALEVVCRLLIWMAEGPSLDERGVRATVALWCVRPDLIDEATLSNDAAFLDQVLLGTAHTFETTRLHSPIAAAPS